MATRINFKTILAKYQNVGKGNVRLTQSTLFLTRPINPTSTVYQFDVLESQTQTLDGNEIRLNLNDEYIITQIGFYIQGKVFVKTEGGFADSGKRVLTTYAPYQTSVGEANKLASFYDGAFQIAVNNIVYLDKYDTRKAEVTPITNTQNLLAGTNSAAMNSIDFSQNGLYGTEPLLTLSGAKKNTLTLTLPSAMDVATFLYTDGTNTQYQIVYDRVCVKFLGLNAQNGASFQK
jgi:hypothetical protein